MSEMSTIARPYAQAVFELAKETGDYAAWSEALDFAAALVRDESMVALINNPRVERERLADLLVELCAGKVPDSGTNLLRLMTGSHRLLALPAVAEQYERMRSEAEGLVEAEIRSAQPVSEEQQGKISSALEKRLGRKVNLTVIEDKNLLGGAVIQAGDLVIDGSAKGRLEKLASALAR